MDKAANLRAGYFINLRMVVIGLTYLEICRHIQQYSGITSSGVKRTTSEKIMTELHHQVREQVKKNRSGQP